MPETIKNETEYLILQSLGQTYLNYLEIGDNKKRPDMLK